MKVFGRLIRIWRDGGYASDLESLSVPERLDSLERRMAEAERVGWKLDKRAQREGKAEDVPNGEVHSSVPSRLPNVYLDGAK